jgi:hypothetical protein
MKQPYRLIILRQQMRPILSLLGLFFTRLMVIIIPLCMGCSKKMDATTGITTVQPPSDSQIFVGGTIIDSSSYKTGYWENGIFKTLSTDSHDQVGCIFVQGNDVYAAGIGSNLIQYWKNGVPTVLKRSSDYIEFTSLFVAGSDVYVTGDEIHLAEYWKNGKEIDLPGISVDPIAIGLFVSGSDVYVAGDDLDMSNKNIAVYWKNGVEHILPDSGYFASAFAVTVSGDDVYVAGHINSNPAYWKNGVPTILSAGPGGNVGGAYSITVSGSHVYVSGFEQGSYGTLDMFWDNGVAIELLPFAYISNNALANNISVSGADVYVCGTLVDPNTNTIAKYWKNGTEVSLGKGTANSIFVKAQ